MHIVHKLTKANMYSSQKRFSRARYTEPKYAHCHRYVQYTQHTHCITRIYLQSFSSIGFLG